MSKPKTLTERLKALQLEKTQGEGASAAKEIPRKGLRTLSTIGRAILSKTSSQGKKSLANGIGPRSTLTQGEPSHYGLTGQSESPLTVETEGSPQAQEKKTSAPSVKPPTLPHLPQQSEVVGDESDWYGGSQQPRESAPRLYPMSLPPVGEESHWYDEPPQPQGQDGEECADEGPETDVRDREAADEYKEENNAEREEAKGTNEAEEEQAQQRRPGRPRKESTHSSHDPAAQNYRVRGHERSFRRRQRRRQKSLVDGFADGGFNCASPWRNFNRARNPGYVDLRLEGRPMMDQYNLIKNRTLMDPTVNVPRGYEPGELRKSQFRMRRQIGSGAFGQVFLMRDRKTNFPVAVKVCEKMKFRHGPWLQREVKIQSQLDHPNIVLLYGYWQNLEFISLALEYCPHGSISDYIHTRENGIVRDERAALWTYQLASALHYLHMRNILHRDVKSENVLISSNGDAKLCDFGWAAFGGINGRRRTFNGTVDYRAPESWCNRHGYIEYDARIDLWALGCILFEMLNGRLPFFGTGGTIARAIIRCQCHIDPEVCPMAADLIRRVRGPGTFKEDDAKSFQILVKYPERRIRPQQIMDHAWIRHYTRPGEPEPGEKPATENQEQLEREKENEQQRLSDQFIQEENLAWQLDYQIHRDEEQPAKVEEHEQQRLPDKFNQAENLAWKHDLEAGYDEEHRDKQQPDNICGIKGCDGV